MSALRGDKPLHHLFLIPLIGLACAALSVSPVVRAQTAAISDQQNLKMQTGAYSEATVSLQQLLNEAEQNNPQIRAARQGWEAAKQVPPQVSAMPDPQVVLQQFNVGSPRPFAGYTNSDFAYVGLGVRSEERRVGKEWRSRWGSYA